MKKTFLLFALTTFTTAAFADSGTTGINDAADGVVTYMPYVRALCYAIAAIIAVVGAIPVYLTMQTNPQNTTKRISMTVGSALTFVCLSLALPQFFGVDGSTSGGGSSTGSGSSTSGTSGSSNGFLASDKGGISQSGIITTVPTLADRKAPDQQTMSGIREALRHVRDGHPLGLFPAGAVSDLSLKDRCIRDREWQEPILRFIRKVELPVVPVRFFDRNSDFYYLLGLIDWRIRVLRLPREVLNKTGRQVRVGIGAPISPEAQAACSTLEDFGALLRDSVYSMKPATSKP